MLILQSEEELINIHQWGEDETEEDNVNHPNHYISEGGLETIDVIEKTLGKKKFIGYCWGNVIKYVSRWPKKGGVEDLKKARWYISKMIERLE